MIKSNVARLATEQGWDTRQKFSKATGINWMTINEVWPIDCDMGQRMLKTLVVLADTLNCNVPDLYEVGK